MLLPDLSAEEGCRRVAPATLCQTNGARSILLPLATSTSDPSGSCRCNPSDSTGAAVGHVSHSSGVVRVTGMAFEWTAPTTALGSVVRKANTPPERPNLRAPSATPAGTNRANSVQMARLAFPLDDRQLQVTPCIAAFDLPPLKKLADLPQNDRGRAAPAADPGSRGRVGTADRGDQAGVRSSAAKLTPLITDPRNPAFVTHSVADILRARMLAIARGYEDGDNLDHLRTDPGFKLACGRLSDSGTDPCSQPTLSRWETHRVCAR
jgi:hypothetical protein